MRRGVWKSILLGGFVAGTIDVGAAALINWLNPTTILRVIAGGLLGRASLHDGMPATVLGLVLQWAMSLVIAAIYVFASRRLPVLAKQWALGGLAYGVATFAVMNYVVVPLSAYKSIPHFTVERFAENLLAMLLFGVIVAFFARSSKP